MLLAFLAGHLSMIVLTMCAVRRGVADRMQESLMRRTRELAYLEGYRARAEEEEEEEEEQADPRPNATP